MDIYQNEELYMNKDLGRFLQPNQDMCEDMS